MAAGFTDTSSSGVPGAQANHALLQWLEPQFKEGKGSRIVGETAGPQMIMTDGSGEGEIKV